MIKWVKNGSHVHKNTWIFPIPSPLYIQYSTVSLQTVYMQCPKNRPPVLYHRSPRIPFSEPADWYGTALCNHIRNYMGVHVLLGAPQILLLLLWTSSFALL